MTKKRNNDIMLYHNQKERMGVMKNMPPLTEAQKRAKEKYNRKVTKVSIEFYPEDAELLNKVREQPNKQAYIKELIRKDLNK